MDNSGPNGYALQQRYQDAYRVPEKEQWYTPTVFAGDRYFIGQDRVMKDLPVYLKRAMASGGLRVPPPAKSTAVAAMPAIGRNGIGNRR